MDFIRRAQAQQGVGVVLASRSAAAFATFPPMLRQTESAFNEWCADVTGTRGDYCYGPFLMHRAMVPHVLRVEPSLGWGWRPSTFVAALRRGSASFISSTSTPAPPINGEKMLRNAGIAADS
jgi:hypothetical protein